MLTFDVSTQQEEAGHKYEHYKSPHTPHDNQQDTMHLEFGNFKSEYTNKAISTLLLLQTKN